MVLKQVSHHWLRLSGCTSICTIYYIMAKSNVLHLFFTCTFACTSAVAGDDFLTPDPFSVTFDAGTSNDTLACVFLSTIDDNDFETNHDFMISIASTTPNITIGVPASSAVILLDNEGMSKSLLFPPIRVSY